MQVKTMMVRMRLATLNQLKKDFPAERNESLADYFERLSEWLNNEGRY